jgi:uncharacterized protein YqiB (DUF1249 family)
MLLESQLVPQTIIRPNSFVGLMSLYESNYLRVRRLIPEIERLDGCFRSTVAGQCDLHVEIIERCRYTVTLSVTYLLSTEAGRLATPDMVIRVYLDGELAEAMSVAAEPRHDHWRKLMLVQDRELSARWKRNIMLNKWLEYLSDQGHLILER